MRSAHGYTEGPPEEGGYSYALNIGRSPARGKERSVCPERTACTKALRQEKERGAFKKVKEVHCSEVQISGTPNIYIMVPGTIWLVRPGLEVRPSYSRFRRPYRGTLYCHTFFHQRHGSVPLHTQQLTVLIYECHKTKGILSE